MREEKYIDTILLLFPGINVSKNLNEFISKNKESLFAFFVTNPEILKLIRSQAKEYRVTLTDIYNAYIMYCTTYGFTAISRNKFSTQLAILLGESIISLSKERTAKSTVLVFNLNLDKIRSLKIPFDFLEQKM